MRVYVDAHRVARDTGQGLSFMLAACYWLIVFPMYAPLVWGLALVYVFYGALAALVFAVLGRPHTGQSILKNTWRQSVPLLRHPAKIGRLK